MSSESGPRSTFIMCSAGEPQWVAQKVWPENSSGQVEEHDLKNLENCRRFYVTNTGTRSNAFRKAHRLSSQIEHGGLCWNEGGAVAECIFQDILARFALVMVDPPVALCITRVDDIELESMEW